MKEQISAQRVSKIQQMLQAGKAVALTLFFFLLLDLSYFIIIWPDWTSLEQGLTPKSRFMENYSATKTIKWQPLTGSLPQSLTRPFVIAEDSRFYQHHGFDWQSIQDAMRINWQAKRWLYGASTISQQTVKNLFLSHERSLLRKWHELVLTIFMEQHVSKNRILAHYLNIAEFGPGIFGVEAAAQHYFGRNFYSLNQREAAALAATLPSPRRHNPHTVTNFFRKKRDRVISILNLPKQTPAEKQVIEFMPPPKDDEVTSELDHHDEQIAIEEIEAPTEAEAMDLPQDSLIPTTEESQPSREEDSSTDEDETSEEYLENFDPSSDYD
ncbi:MAG: monofunctional biosynthetic peptidoglycan transglycosylase [Oligoflexus sp.]